MATTVTSMPFEIEIPLPPRVPGQTYVIRISPCEMTHYCEGRPTIGLPSTAGYIVQSATVAEAVKAEISWAVLREVSLDALSAPLKNVLAFKYASPGQQQIKDLIGDWDADPAIIDLWQVEVDQWCDDGSIHCRIVVDGTDKLHLVVPPLYLPDGREH